MVDISVRQVTLRRLLSLLICIGCMSGPVTVALAQELGPADRLAMLYSTQLRFDASGEPLIRIGIVEDEQEVTLRTTGPLLVQPLGERGPEVELPAGRYTVAIENGMPGQYTYHVVVDEMRPSERDAIREASDRWSGRSHPVGYLQLGATFAVRGSTFDTRKVLIVLGPLASREEAMALRDRLVDEEGVDARVHAELDAYPTGSLSLRGENTGVVIRHRDLLWLRSTDGSPILISQVAYDRGTRFEGREDRRYSGRLAFTPDRDGRLAVVNEVSAETLLRGIVPAEIFSNAPAHALRAQAVAARTELLADLGVRHLSEPWMTCADQRCQVYRGLAFEHASTSAAVEATRGRVLVHEDQIINAFFSSNNGGFSANNGPTWGGTPRPYLPERFDGPNTPPEYADGLQEETVVRRFLEDSPDGWSRVESFSSGRNFRWQTTLEAGALNTAVAARYPQLGAVQNLEVLQRDRSGRINRLRIVGRNGEVVVERELNIRRTLGGLRSALMVFDIDRDRSGALVRVRIRGAGFGHGVGLCQTGSIGSAERGRTYQQILNNYYPGTELRELY